MLDEPESAVLRTTLSRWPRRVTSRIAVVEVIRGVREIDQSLERLARHALEGVDLVTDTDRILLAAAQLDPVNVRTLDAIHVASALRERSAVTAFVSYDARQLQTAEAAGLPCVSPR